MSPRITISSTVAALAAGGLAQVQPASNLIEQALASSQIIAARTLQVREAEQMARSAGFPKNPELELSPGLGFTNSNFLLGQSFDLSGQRAAAARRARAEVGVAQALLRKAQLAVASEALEALANFQAALANEANARLSFDVANATLTAIRKRIEIGEAPALQATRAEVELQRTEHALIIAQSEVAVQRATLNSLLGKPSDSETPEFAWPGEINLQLLSSRASTQRPETVEGLARIKAAFAAELEARRRVLPTVFAGIAADTWSVDRRPFQSDNLGIQLRLSMPLFDHGENRYILRAFESARKTREAELNEARRRIGLEVETALAQLEAARAVAKSFETGIVPKAELMVQSLQRGMESGIASFLDVLEAQRTLAQLRREATDASRIVQLAEVRFLAAVGSMPGLEPQP